MKRSYAIIFHEKDKNKTQYFYDSISDFNELRQPIQYIIDMIGNEEQLENFYIIEEFSGITYDFVGIAKNYFNLKKRSYEERICDKC